MRKEAALVPRARSNVSSSVLQKLYYEGQEFLYHSRNETFQAHMSAIRATATNTDGG